MSRYLIISILLVFFCGIAFVNSALSFDKSNLVAYWSFNKGSGNTVADESGNGFDGKVMGGEWAKDGKESNAMDFDGADAYVEIASDPGLDPGEDGWTVELWVKRFDSDVDWHEIVTKYPCCNYQGYRLGFHGNNVHVLFGIGAPPNCAEVVSTSKIEDQEWHHLAFTADRGGDVIIYIDGVPDETTGAIGQIEGESIITDQNLEIGRCHWCGGAMGFFGTADEVKIWRAALTEAEIQQAMSGKLMAVSPEDALSTCWGDIKSKI